MKTTTNSDRRSFLQSITLVTSTVGIGGASLLWGCQQRNGENGTQAGEAGDEEGEKSEEEVSPPEDLMREHGLLNRILLIYDTSITRLNSKEDFSPESLHNAAGIIRTFIEDYHEKLEENYLFPRFRKANKLTDLVQVLQRQHDAGRALTDQILQYSNMPALSKNEGRQQLVNLLSQFNRMYRPHEAREDTVLFPALKEIVSSNEYDAMGEDFEKKEHELFGEDGFATMVDKVAGIEKQMGIYELSQFTPTLPG
ncbi:hemerythrin domain-containing protein [Pontibacter sp. 172403-2]|uniref:hemerythrin domain-containing protein n=1 Tax=Pontibacter rufus TaxID=2791028 RepID=UPI0018AFDC49|nr:hemerythrin domain-containing protein [Pontibacter sp. 172403-2]MBF9252176.1 hemerythrin domain-containing protein [Pontibacter sp. 172403-2]